MLYDSEIVVDLSFRVPEHACYYYTGFYAGLNRNQWRQNCRDRTFEYKKQTQAYQTYMQIEKTVSWFNWAYLQTQSLEDLKETFGETLYLNPWGYLIVSKPKAKLSTLVKRGYLPIWYIENITRMQGPAWMIPLPPRGQRKLDCWQLPPRCKASQQAHGLFVDYISAVDLFPEEWRPKDAYEIEDEDQV